MTSTVGTSTRLGVTPVAGVDLQVRRGELICLLGPPGAGKSTLLRIVAGTPEPDEGTVLIAGSPACGSPAGGGVPG